LGANDAEAAYSRANQIRADFGTSSKNAFGVLGRRKKLCGDDTGHNKRETYKFCIVKKYRATAMLSPCSVLNIVYTAMHASVLTPRLGHRIPLSALGKLPQLAVSDAGTNR